MEKETNTENADSKLNFEKYKFNIELFKWLIGSVALVIITLIIDTKFKDRTAGLQEIQHYDKYVTDLIILNKEVGPRRLLAQYFANVTASDELRERWKEYYKEVDKEYKELIKQDSITKIELNKLKSKDSTEQTISDKLKVQDLKEKQKEIKIQINSEVTLPSDNPNEEWLIIAGGVANLDEAKQQITKIKNLNLNLNGIIYKKENMYRVVIGPFLARNSAQSSLVSVKNNINNDAYVVRLNSWCTNSQAMAGFIECK